MNEGDGGDVLDGFTRKFAMWFVGGVIVLFFLMLFFSGVLWGGSAS